MPKPKPNPARTAEDELMKRASPAARKLMDEHRKLARAAARKAWWAENKP